MAEARSEAKKYIQMLNLEPKRYLFMFNRIIARFVWALNIKKYLKFIVPQKADNS